MQAADDSDEPVQEESLVCYFVGRIVLACFFGRPLVCHAFCHCAIGPIYRVAAQILCCLVSVGFVFRLVSRPFLFDDQEQAGEDEPGYDNIEEE